MIDYRIISHEESKICIIESNRSTDELLAELKDTKNYLADLNAIRTEQRKKEFLVARIALKTALDGEEKQIEYTRDGKPILKDGSQKISFSHCRSHVAVIVHPSMEVGIDIENPSNKLLMIAERFLGEEELAEYRKHYVLDYLRIAWSVKEALYKIIGDKAYNFAEQLRIQPFRLEKQGSLQALHTDTAKKYLVHYLLTDNFTLAYCIDSEHLEY